MFYQFLYWSAYIIKIDKNLIYWQKLSSFIYTQMDLINNILAAGISAVITVSFIHPIDVIKTRLQISNSTNNSSHNNKTNIINYKNLGINKTIQTIFKNEGFGAFWKGIQAAWIREATYTSLRLGLYSPLKEHIDPTNKYGFSGKFVIGCICGGIGSFVGNPFDVVKTRLISIEGKNDMLFKNIFQHIYKTEGIGGFYSGLNVNIMRACVLNGTQMSCYEQIKQLFIDKGFDKLSIQTQFVSAFSAGFFMALTVTPFDMIRTQLMNQPKHIIINNTNLKNNFIDVSIDAGINTRINTGINAGIDMGKYNGFLDCGMKIIKNNGIKGLYSGFIPIWIRFAPTTTLQLVIFEQIKPLFI